MKKILEVAGLCVAFALALSGSGCITQPTGDAPANIATTTATATPTTPVSSSTLPSAAELKASPVTLPVLDAFFADESFAAELKTKLQLTDDQINRLRTTAREETAKLRETDTEEYGGSTADALARASEQIRGVVGEEKGQQLAALVSERWRGGVDSGVGNGSSSGTAGGGATATPNSIPQDTRVVVNAPAYRMDVFENGQLIKSYKVGIGYPEFPLPTGLRKASTIIFNPTWTPPDEPWVESPSSKVKVGEKVEAGSKLNPLGLIKIPIGSPSLIHGGKSPAKLGTFASHGCVGLTDPLVQDFSKLLAKVGGAQMSDQHVAGYAKNRTETKEVKLDRPIPVELRYETIVVTDDGKLHIYRDVYDRDTNTEENLRAVLQAHGMTLEQLSEAERTKALDALKQMARDATGRPTAGSDASANANASPGASAGPSTKSGDNSNAAGGGNSADRKVTRTVKGQKEIVIDLPALKGKGYPASVQGNTRGTSRQPQAAAGGARRQG